MDLPELINLAYMQFELEETRTFVVMNDTFWRIDLSLNRIYGVNCESPRFVFIFETRR